MGSAGPWMGSPGLSTFYFYLIYRGGHFNRFDKDLLTVTF
jgi:hypothetical protein